MPFGTPGTFVAIAGLALALGLLIWVRRRRRTVALPQSLTTGPSVRSRPPVDDDGPPDRPADPGATDIHLDLGTLAPDPWT